MEEEIQLDQEIENLARTNKENKNVVQNHFAQICDAQKFIEYCPEHLPNAVLETFAFWHSYKEVYPGKQYYKFFGEKSYGKKFMVKVMEDRALCYLLLCCDRKLAFSSAS